MVQRDRLQKLTVLLLSLGLLLAFGSYDVGRSGDIQAGKVMPEKSATFYVH